MFALLHFPSQADTLALQEEESKKSSNLFGNMEVDGEWRHVFGNRPYVWNKAEKGQIKGKKKCVTMN